VFLAPDLLDENAGQVAERLGQGWEELVRRATRA